MPDADPVQNRSQLIFSRKFQGERPDLGTWKFYKDEMPPKECTLVLFTEEYGGHDNKDINVSLGFACDLYDHMMADLRMFGKEGLRFRFWQFVPLPPSLEEKMAYVGESSPALIHK